MSILSLGIQVSQALVDYYSSYRHQNSDISVTFNKLDGLLTALHTLQRTIPNRKFRPDERDVVKSVESSIFQCEDLIAELRSELDKFQYKPGSSAQTAIKTTGRRLIFPFRQSTLQKINEDVGEIRANLSLALNVLQLNDSKKVQDDIFDVRLLLDTVRADQTSSTVRDWLRAPDATINHNEACAKRHAGTGQWFVQSASFNNWLVSPNSFLWLHGIAGCGKSVLCSTAIQYAFRHQRSDPAVGIAFFYFTFNDETKQEESAMLRALLLQLFGQTHDDRTDLARPQATYRNGLPPVGVLRDHLRHAVLRFKNVYIIVDAVDESPRYEKRDQVLEAFGIIRNWALPQLHLLLASRDEPDIRNNLQPESHEDIVMNDTNVDKDIANFIAQHLTENRSLSHWSPYHDRIEAALTKGAKGV